MHHIWTHCFMMNTDVHVFYLYEQPYLQWGLQFSPKIIKITTKPTFASQKKLDGVTCWVKILQCVFQHLLLWYTCKKYQKQRHVVRVAETALRWSQTHREKTFSLELSANPPRVFSVMWFPPESIGPPAHRQNRTFTSEHLFPSFALKHAHGFFVLPRSCESGRISALQHNL